MTIASSHNDLEMNRSKLPRRAVRFGSLIVWLLTFSLFCGAAGPDKDVRTWEQDARSAIDSGDLASVQSLAQQRLDDPATAATAHWLLGLVDLRQRRYAEAISHFQSAKQLGVQPEELFEPWSEALQKLGRVFESCQILEEELLRNPSPSGLRSRLADLYLALGKPQQALPHLEEVYRRGTRNAGVTFQLASARFAAGQDYRAVELLDPLIGSVSSANLLLQIGKLYFRNLLYRQAVVPLRRAWELSRPDYENGMFLALTHYQLEQYADSVPILEEVKPNAAETLEYHILKGSVLARVGRWDDARRELEQAVASADRRADGYLNLGLFWMEREEPQKAWELLERGSSLMTPGTKVIYTFGTRQNCDGLSPPKANEPRSKHRAEFFANLAERLHKTHHWISALELFRAALEEDSHLRAPYGGIGLICQELGSPEVGRSFLQQGIELHPQAADLRFYLGTVLSALGRQEEAMSSYMKALALDGSNPPARHWLFLGMAQVAGNKENQEKAKQSFVRAIETDPQLALAHYELGKWYLKDQDFESAEKSLQRAIELDPHLLGAYYQLGIACTRNRKTQKAQELMAVFQRKKALRDGATHTQPKQELMAPDVP